MYYKPDVWIGNIIFRFRLLIAMIFVSEIFKILVYHGYMFYVILGKEDCLWLNVFTRDLVVKKKRKVVVWIHGGNFVRGSARE